MIRHFHSATARLLTCVVLPAILSAFENKHDLKQCGNGLE